jgi:hypothetical protein
MIVVTIEWELNQTDEPIEALGLLFKKTCDTNLQPLPNRNYLHGQERQEVPCRPAGLGSVC